MIVLAAFDPTDSRAQVERLDIPIGLPDSSEQLMRRIAGALGVGDIAFSTEPVSGGIEHRWLIIGDELHYHASFRQHRDSIGDFTRYLGVALCTAGAAKLDMLRRVHSAVHELGANSLEHGRATRGRPMLQLHLSISVRSIGGRLVDQCLPFNPLQMEPVAIQERVALRARRGYGISLARRLLDQLDYAYREGTNQLSFQQKLP